MTTELDHLVVAAGDLDSACDALSRLFGAPFRPGGVHHSMGTHNRLLKIGPRQYLEVIAIDHSRPDPGVERWFGLDRMPVGSPPRLVAWVARTSQIARAAASSPWGPASVTEMSRGQLTWSISLPAADLWHVYRLFPMLIQWPENRHPCDALPESGVQLKSLRIRHPEAGQLAASFSRCGLQIEAESLEISQGLPDLSAVFDTPGGVLEFRGT